MLSQMIWLDSLYDCTSSAGSCLTECQNCPASDKGTECDHENDVTLECSKVYHCYLLIMNSYNYGSRKCVTNWEVTMQTCLSNACTIKMNKIHAWGSGAFL